MSWLKRRTQFNHNWLVNQFIPALARFLNLLDGRTTDPEFERSFVGRVLPAWELHRKEALALAQSFEREMSPQARFDRPPLARCNDATKEWLGRLVHELWLVRYPVSQWTFDASDAIRRVDNAYDNLTYALESCANIRSTETLRPLRGLFSDFHQSCQRLADIFSNCPTEVNVE